MATQTILPAGSTSKASSANIKLPSSFNIRAQDSRLEQRRESPKTDPDPPVPLGVLEAFTDTFAGTGFNLIFRPNSGPPTTTTFSNPINPPAPQAPSENVLELNLTTETLSFSKDLGSVPNRGLGGQNDIFLNGVPYIQVINDVSNPKTGKGDADPPQGIHFEPGLWMRVPATNADPVLGETLARMASIPHGTTINAQCLAPTSSFPGAPKFPVVDITPFVIGNPNNKIRFIAQQASRTDTPRLPQDLSAFIATGTISQNTLDNPNFVLERANDGKNITQTTVFTVSTNPVVPSGGDPTTTSLDDGTANIAFLQGTGAGANADAAKMEATFWINVVQYEIEVPKFKPGDAPLRIRPASPNKSVQAPTFVINPSVEITEPRSIKVSSTEIQYSQVVNLNFAGLTWPHVSVATLAQTLDVPVSDSAFH